MVYILKRKFSCHSRYFMSLSPSSWSSSLYPKVHKMCLYSCHSCRFKWPTSSDWMSCLECCYCYQSMNTTGIYFMKTHLFHSGKWKRERKKRFLKLSVPSSSSFLSFGFHARTEIARESGLENEMTWMKLITRLKVSGETQSVYISCQKSVTDTFFLLMIKLWWRETGKTVHSVW